MHAVIEKARETIRKEPLNSVLTLTNVTKAGFNEEVTRSLKNFTLHNKPYVIAGAVIGVSEFKQVILNSVMWFSIRRFHAFT